MQVELNAASQAKIEDMIEQLSMRYDMEEVTSSELIDALLDLGIDLIVGEDGSMPLARARLLEYCGEKLQARSI